MSRRTTPPELHSDWYIDRPRLRSHVPSTNRLLLIKGKAGQGKSVFASALYRACESDKLWFTIDQRDSNPALFVHRFQKACADLLGLPKLDQADEPIEFSDQFLDKLSELPATTFFFDNTHLLNDQTSAEHCLAQLVRGIAEEHRIVLASRSTMPTLGLELAAHNGLVIDDPILAFTYIESLKLLEKASAFNSADTDVIHEISMGWPLCLNQVTRMRSDNLRRSGADSIAEAAMRHCFGLLAHSAGEDRLRLLARLTVPRHFESNYLSEQHALLEPSLAVCGDFVASDSDGFMRFTPQLRKFLRGTLTRFETESDVSVMLNDYIDRSLEQGRLLDVIDGLCQLDDIERLEKTLKEDGAGLTPNYWDEALHLIESMSAPVTDETPYLQLYKARWCADTFPQQSRELLERCRDTFVSKADETGELRSLIYRTELQFSLGRVKPIETFFERLLTLQQEVGDTLADFDRGTLAIHFAGIAVYVTGDSEQAQSQLNQASRFFGNAISTDDRVHIEYLRAMDHIFNGRRAAMFAALESLANTPDIARENVKISLAFLRATFLAATAQNNHLEYLIRDELEKLDSRVLEQRMTGGYFRLRQCHFMLIRGEYQGVLDLISEVEHTVPFTTDGDAREQGLRVMALAHALLGEHQQARKLLSQVGELSSTHQFRVNQMTAVALAHIEWEDWDTATTILTELSQMQDEDADLADSSAGVLAFCLERQGRYEEAEPYLRRWMKLAVSSDRPDVIGFGSTRDCLLHLIRSASQYAEVSFQRFTSRLVDRLGLAFDEKFNVIPMLDIRSAPAHVITLDGEPVKLTKSQRRILMLLALSPNKKMARQALLTALWPEENNADSRLYMQISRLRKAFDQQNVTLSNYLVVTPGELELTNTYVDVAHFESEMLIAESYERNDYDWLGRLVRMAALDLWPGFFDPSLEVLLEFEETKRSAIMDYQRSLLQLADTSVLTEALEERLISHLTSYLAAEPENLSIAVSLARLYRRLGDAPGLYMTREKFREGLQKLELPEEEIAVQIQHFDSAETIEPHF